MLRASDSSTTLCLYNHAQMRGGGKEPRSQGPGFFVWSSTLAATDTCHLRLNEGERSKFERAAGHLKISLSRLARDAWEWWLEQE